jgi:hypothetical protein
MPGPGWAPRCGRAIELWDLDRQQAHQVERLVNAPFMLQDRTALVNQVLSRGKKRS